jgi:hypothetical protein
MEYNAETQRLIDLSRKADVLRDFKVSPYYNTLRAIFDALDQKAFETFKKVDPSDVNGVIQTQMMSKVISQLWREIDNTIREGDLALQTLSMMEDE